MVESGSLRRVTEFGLAVGEASELPGAPLCRDAPWSVRGIGWVCSFLRGRSTERPYNVVVFGSLWRVAEFHVAVGVRQTGV